MPCKALPVIAVLLGFHAFTPQQADADPLRIQSGFVFVNGDPTQSLGLDFALSGLGFSFVGEDPTRHDYVDNFSPWEPPFRLRFTDVPDPSSNSSCPGCAYTGDLLFQFSPAGPDGTTAFTMAGLLTGMSGGSPATAAQLRGGGRMLAGPNGVLFQFEADPAPVPEPSTLLLLGTGTALMLRRLRR